MVGEIREGMGVQVTVRTLACTLSEIENHSTGVAHFKRVSQAAVFRIEYDGRLVRLFQVRDDEGLVQVVRSG